jgi:hypothetical protein
VRHQRTTRKTIPFPFAFKVACWSLLVLNSVSQNCCAEQLPDPQESAIDASATDTRLVPPANGELAFQRFGPPNRRGGFRGRPGGAQNDPPPGVVIFSMLICYGPILLVIIGIQILIIVIIRNSLDAIPQQFREIEPNMAWLMLVPLLNIVWPFFLFPKTARSFQNYFRATGQPHDDCGEQTGMYYAICTVGSMVPCLGFFAGIAALIFLIIVLIKFTELRNRVRAGGFAPQKPMVPTAVMPNQPYSPNHPPQPQQPPYYQPPPPTYDPHRPNQGPYGQ